MSKYLGYIIAQLFVVAMFCFLTWWFEEEQAGQAAQTFLLIITGFATAINMFGLFLHKEENRK